MAVSAPEPPADAVTACNPGEPSPALQTATLDLVNYFRQMSQVQPVGFDEVLSAKAEQAALMMYANDALDHDPPSSWQCFSADGADGAAHANLALGYRGAEVVRGYMDDDGPTNTAVGHRRWLQRPAAQLMGSGTVGTAHALWVVGDEPAVAVPTYTTWPSAGYFPQQLDPNGRWSFTASDPAYDLSAATVAVVDERGDQVSIMAYPVADLRSLVFEVGDLPEAAGSGVDDYRVTVSNILVDDQPIQPFSYTVSRFDPTAPVTPPSDPVLAATSPLTIDGDTVVDSTLLATAPTWSEAGVTTTYQWLRDNQPIDGADTEQLTLTAADVGRQISVRATGTKTGFTSAAVESAQVGPIARISTSLGAAGHSLNRGRLVLEMTLSSASGPLDGAVTIKEGSKLVASGVKISGGRGEFTAIDVTPGRHTYDIAYAGTSRLAAATSRVGVTVAAKTPPVISLKASSPSAEKVKITITVSAPYEPSLGGTVTVKEGSTTRAKLKVSKGKAAYAASKVKSGPHTYTVTYNGSSHVSVASQRVQVTVKAKVPSTMTLTGSSPSANKVKITIGVRADGQGPLGGTVSIKDGSKKVKSGLRVSKGKATYSASKVKAGKHTYQVSYSGTSEVHGTSKTVTVTVKAPVKMKSYARCDDMAKDYPHGVGRTNASDQTSGDPVTNFFRNNTLYSYNDGGSGQKDLDRDNDGIACERH